MTVVLYDGSKHAKTGPAQPPAPGPSHQAPLDMREVSRLPFPREQIFIMYTSERILRGGGEIHRAPRADRALTWRCYVALSTTYFGIEHQQQSIVREGLGQYVRVLGDLNRSLGSRKACQSFDILEAVLTLSIFEVCIYCHEPLY